MISDNTTINTRRLRLSIGILGILLPWIVVLILLYWPQSISITYYSLFTVGTFTGILSAASMCLFAYKGYDKVDDVVSTIASIFGVLIVLFPMTYLDAPETKVGILHLPSEISNIFHTISAMSFFTILAFMSFFLFTKTSGEMTKQKKIKNIIYRVCGIGMMVSFLLLLLNLIPGVNIYNLTWIVEAIALFFFGTSWIVKADAIPFLKDNK